MRAHRILLAALAIGSASLVFSPLLAQVSPPPVGTSARDWSPRRSPVTDVVRRVRDAVVDIQSERSAKANASDELFSVSPSQNRVSGMGTGIIIDPRGYIVTNQHVVDDVSSLRVRLADGTNLAARVVARDTESDLALLKITAPKPLATMPLGTAGDVQVGETTVAIGNAYGYDHTVTVGIVSAVGRDVTLNREVKYRQLIQTDAAINPGNSGGPLLNLDGELIGINVAIRAGAQGIGFAIPVDQMIQMAGTMLARTRGVAPVGLTVRDDVRGAVSTRRVVVDRVDAAAAKAGLRAGDVVTRMGDLPVNSSLDVERALLDLDGGAKVPVLIRRDGADRRAELVLEALRGDVRPTVVTGATPTAVWRALGMKLGTLPNAAEALKSHPRLNGGLLISEVRPDSPAAKAGMKGGDVLVGLHTWEMLTLDNVNFVLTHPERHTWTPIQFYIVRGNQVHRGWLTPSAD
jgi:serine protease Do